MHLATIRQDHFVTFSPVSLGNWKYRTVRGVQTVSGPRVSPTVSAKLDALRSYPASAPNISCVSPCQRSWRGPAPSVIKKEMASCVGRRHDNRGEPPPENQKYFFHLDESRAGEPSFYAPTAARPTREVRWLVCRHTLWLPRWRSCSRRCWARRTGQAPIYFRRWTKGPDGHG